MVMTSKVISRSSPAYAKGGGNKMVGKTGAGQQKSGTTSGAAHGPMSGGYAKGGGSGRMVGKQTAGHCKPL